MKGKVLICLMGMLVLFGGIVLQHGEAVEGGLGHYPIGNEDFMMGAIPPPGFYFINYFLYYNVQNYKDLRAADGTKLRDVLATPRVRGDTVVNAMRFVYVSKFTILGANWTTHLIVPFQYLHLKADIGPIGVTGTKTGLKDITFAPVALPWHYKNFHWYLALDIDIPVGNYNKNDVANTGNNYWTFRPIVGASYVSDSGFEVSAKVGYNINTTNHSAPSAITGASTSYRSGQELLVEYLVGQKLGSWNLGINGYYYQQTTKDRIGYEAPNFDGNKGRAFAIGPAIQYNYKNMFFKLKYQWETAVKNKPEGQRAWFNFVYAF